ncbi:MAG TPA: hypothetical protein VNE39_03995 [Planctomycetota bacterium]|nr:hypothetical protein [Planctomycetota bacterium]
MTSSTPANGFVNDTMAHVLRACMAVRDGYAKLEYIVLREPTAIASR